jgi:tetratricopeptide (TPR) repeat protein
MSPDPDKQTSNDARFEEAVLCYLKAVDSGQAPSPDSFVAAYPGLETQLLAFIADQNQLAALTPLRLGTAGLEPGQSLGDYELLGELGRGGMGVVYRARQKGLNRLVALKMILAGPHAGRDNLARFQAEAEAVARLQHPNVVQIHEIGEHDGLPFFAMEFCAGGTLERRLGGTPLPPRQAAVLAETLARAVQAAHEKGIVHRDLKPGNILLTEGEWPSEEKERKGGQLATVKITDFGLAKTLDGAGAGQTHSGAIVGTPSYMAPEQAAGKSKDVGHAADIYALGAVLYELLSGRPPFRAATSLDTLMQVISDEPVPPSRLQSRVPRDLETICLKCLEKEPRKRYATALDLAEDLQRFLDGVPIRARAIGSAERAWRWAKRNPWIAGLAGTIAVLVAATVVSLAAGLVLVNAERQQTALARDEEARRRQQAREALDAMFSEVVEDWLARQQQLTERQKKFLEKALASYEEFARDTGQDEQARAGVARAYFRVADIRQRLGQRRASEEAFRTSQQLYAQLAGDFPSEPDYRWRQAQCQNNLGTLFKATGRLNEARNAYQEAQGIYQQLAEEFPDRPVYRQDLAGSHHNLATLFELLGRATDAETNYARAISHYERLAKEFPAEAIYQERLASSHNSRGVLYGTTGRMKAAEKEYRFSLAIRQQVIKDHPDEPRYRRGLGLRGYPELNY